MGKKLTIRRLLDSRKPDLFWQRSDVNDVFRPSLFFNQIIRGYLTKISISHEKELVHFCQIPLLDNMYFKYGDHKVIRFRSGPVATNDTEDFRTKRPQDYIMLANLIEMVHGFFFLPPIDKNNSPELLSFIDMLRRSSGKEVLIEEHYNLWGANKRFAFFMDLDARCKEVGFRHDFNRALDDYGRLAFDVLYPKGFGVVIRNEKVLCDKLTYEKKKYLNTYVGLVNFARDLGPHYATDKNMNLYTKAEVEWKLFKHFPFILEGACQVLLEMGLYHLLGKGSRVR
ncbi:hypothetical protein LguiA_021516 [Lonicera macranthoides]